MMNGKNTHKRNIVSWLCILAIVIFSNSSFSQEYQKVKRGERPPIDFNKLTDDAWVPGKIRIKIHPNVLSYLNTRSFERSAEGVILTGHESLDQLNERYKVNDIRSLFSGVYDLNPILSDFSERHKAWGLDLWFDLELDPGFDLKEVISEFALLGDVIVAEPEYRKQLVTADNGFWDDDGNDPEPVILTSQWAPNDAQYTSQWHYNNTGQHDGTLGADISLEAAWEIEKGNANVIVAIIDGGIELTHSDLTGNIWDGIGYNFVNNNATILPHNHGTHVAGTVAAVTNNNLGVAGIAGGSGVDDGVRLMSCQVFTSSGNGGFHLAPIFAADNGAAISQNSWAYTSPGVYEQSVLDAIDYFNTNGGGDALIGGISIFAAGNSNASGLWYPACYSGTFSVAATNNQDMKTWYSNYDSWVDISAPGGETNTVAARGVLSTLTNNLYGYYQGTSMACPHVSGVAALIVSNAYGLLTAADLAEILRNSTDNHYSLNPTYTSQLGTGRLNAYAALIELQNVLDGVMNPLHFCAQSQGIDQVALNWTKNNNNHDVIVAWSPDDVFGTPEPGVIYNVGDSIPGGGVVLLEGDAVSLLHQNLQFATQYYYSIWSVNSSIIYSAGLSASACTDCLPVESLPFLENFNASDDTPICWDVVDHLGNGQVWKVGVFTGKVGGTTGNVAYLNSSGYGFGNSQNSDIVTQTLDLTNYIQVNLKFRHYFRQYGSSSSATLSYSVDGGVTWTNIQTWTSTTPNPSTFNQQIPALNGQSNVKIKWNFTGTWGYFWSFDDVEINGVYVPPPLVVDFEADATMLEIDEEVTFIHTGNCNSPCTFLWNFGSDAEPSTATGEGPHVVQYTTAGYKTVSLTVNGSSIALKENYIYVKDIYTLNIESLGPGNVMIDGVPYSGPINLPEGAVVNIQAVPDCNAVFRHWCESLENCMNPVTVTVESNMNLLANFAYFQTATYSEGYIPTDDAFNSFEDSSACPGQLSISLPYNAEILGLDVSYQITSLNTSFMSSQYSQLRCLSDQGLAEAFIFQGEGDHEGTMLYSRTGVDIANAVNGGDLIFELHAGRVSDGLGCNELNAIVDNNTWSITVYYDLVPAAPLVHTLPQLFSNPTSATVGGNVLCDGGFSLLDRGIYWGTEPNPESSGIQMFDSPDIGEFFHALDNLQPATTYYFKAYATNSIGTSMGEEFSFTTASLPEIVTIDADEVTHSSAVVGGEVLDDGGLPVIEYGAFWGTEPDPEINGSSIIGGQGSGLFLSELNGLEPNTSYYYKAYAVNELGFSFGEMKSFTTLPHEIETNVWVDNSVLNTNHDTCFSATLQIVLAGDGKTCFIPAGANIELVAGQSILFLPGANIQQGAYLLARIALNGDYCMNPEPLIASEEVVLPEKEIETGLNSPKPELKIYPNPTRGIFTLEIPEILMHDQISVSIFNTVGEKVHAANISGWRTNEFDLSHLSRGMYLVHTFIGNEAYIEKLIKQ